MKKAEASHGAPGYQFWAGGSSHGIDGSVQVEHRPGMAKDGQNQALIKTAVTAEHCRD